MKLYLSFDIIRLLIEISTISTMTVLFTILREQQINAFDSFKNLIFCFTKQNPLP